MAGRPNRTASTSAEAGSYRSLTPTTAKIIERCPRIRILIIGRSGVGKSSLVNAIFGIPSADVQQTKAGEADIHQEYASVHNERFVLHDSQGYEPGDKKKFKVLEDFVKERTSSDKPVGEQLHAIWLCVPVSFAGGRIFEAGDEKIFKLERGLAPVIVVFTHYDFLFALVKRNRGETMGGNNLVEKEFKERCLKPFEELTQDIQQKIPFIPVSKHHPDTLEKLVEITMQNIQPEIARDKPSTPWLKRLLFMKFGAKKLQTPKPTMPSSGQAENDVQETEDLSDSAQLMLAVAQRVGLDAKIAASVRVGRKKYWRAIASGTVFKDLRLSNCIKVIHTDIVMVWNIRDMSGFFLDNEFRGRMTKIVEDLREVKEGRSFAPQGASSLAAWANTLYNKTADVLRCLMGYTVDLTVIMRAVFQASLRGKDGVILEKMSDE